MKVFGKIDESSCASMTDSTYPTLVKALFMVLLAKNPALLVPST